MLFHVQLVRVAFLWIESEFENRRFYITESFNVVVVFQCLYDVWQFEYELASFFILELQCGWC